MVSALVSVFILGLLVIVHELGHFLAARRAGVRILRFSVGFGPRLIRWTRGETEYAVSAIPLGGYVKMAGEQQAECAHQPWEYLSKPIGTRARIVFAGPFVNYLVALVSLWIVFLVGYPELLPIVGSVVEGTPAHAAGLKPGDRILSVEGHPMASWEEMTQRIHVSPDRPLAFVIERGMGSMTVTITPRPKTIRDPFGRSRMVGLIGISPSGAFHAARLGPVEAVGRTITQQNAWIGQTMVALWSMLTGKLSMRDSVTGPIGIVYLTSEAMRMGVAPLLLLVSLFSLSLALFNLFPIPILDGGHLLFLALEKLRGRPVSVNIQERATQLGFLALMTLVIVVCINDVNQFGLLKKLFGWLR
jgi:regulator of sigma E protease